MPLRTEMPLGTVLYRGQVDKGEVHTIKTLL